MLYYSNGRRTKVQFGQEGLGEERLYLNKNFRVASYIYEKRFIISKRTSAQRKGERVLC